MVLILVLINISILAQNIEKEIQFSKQQILPFYWFKKKEHTAYFQGNKKKENYFEGWYFKMVSKNGAAILSVIPGISLPKEGEKPHAFIQIINGLTAETYYYTFSIEEFYFSKKAFAVRIGDNYFSEKQLILNIEKGDSSVNGSVIMTNQIPYAYKKRKPAIMGWYRFVPFMECYHGVVSLNHQLSGRIILYNKVHDFSEGKGYIEKDWGTSMPKAWIWLQSNTFTNINSSLMLSVADIPWLGKSFTGFLGFFYTNNRVYRFATYANSELNILPSTDNTLTIEIQNTKERFVLEIKNGNAGILKAPVAGSMDRRIAESVDAKLKITMFNEDNEIILIDSSEIAGLEAVGDIRSLITKIK